MISSVWRSLQVIKFFLCRFHLYVYTLILFYLDDITGEGSDFDYSVNTVQLRLLNSRPELSENVSFTFHTDAIAQEENETFTLELVTTPGTNSPPSGDGVFFRNIITITIVDSDGI